MQAGSDGFVKDSTLCSTQWFHAALIVIPVCGLLPWGVIQTLTASFRAPIPSRAQKHPERRKYIFLSGSLPALAAMA